MAHIAGMQDFRRLRVWQAAHQLSLAVYSATKPLPLEERFGLTAQVRRAVVGIQTNIAEGCGRGTRADTSRFLQMAIGSAAETTNHLLLCRDLGYLPGNQYTVLEMKLAHVRRMLIRLLLKLRAFSPQN